MSRGSRALLFTETDEFGNVIDPDSGYIISKAGGQSPNFPPPWVYQTPAFSLFSTRPGPQDERPSMHKEEYSAGTVQIETESNKDKLKSSNSSSKGTAEANVGEREDWTSDGV